MTSQSVNVLIVASHLWIGGAETVIRHLALGLDRRRFNVTVCTLKDRGRIGDELANAGVDIVTLPQPPAGKVDYLTFRKLLHVVRERKIDVVHTHTTHGLLDACLCKLLKPGLRVLHTFHFGNYPHTQPRLILIERIFSRVADRIFAVGRAQRSTLQRVFGFSDAKIGTIWNGVPWPSGDVDAEFRIKANAVNRPLVGTIATFIDQKGLFDLLDVARRIKDSGRDVAFAVVGEGFLRPQLEARRRELGLDSDVYLPGWITNAADLVMPTFDVFFQPSHWEAMSVVILEAMAAGKPVVATRVGENPTVIEDEVDGLLVQSSDIDDMTAALCRVIDDASFAARLGAAARQKVAQQFSVEHMARAYEQVYLELAGAQ